jgi:hypothetical protein
MAMHGINAFFHLKKDQNLVNLYRHDEVSGKLKENLLSTLGTIDGAQDVFEGVWVQKRISEVTGPAHDSPGGDKEVTDQDSMVSVFARVFE